ncbi:iron-containing alcohol dehydrogenase [Metarhizium guizhouense ARSEF 977]|uniref:Iron-containing alcohol dehydrogenase n=1 Tax=Metarhizium guizhouense (strain ARSEF 977) TaxID=1276136 RepID=A0A0B4GP37_METGA|nr:iron-containing alcohol dehydrogenase [Metarhizium guizhouense ARSEF 977]
MRHRDEEYFLALSSKPHVSIGIPFQDACKFHADETFQAKKIYIIVSSSISKTENFAILRNALGAKICGIRHGIKPHTPWPEVLEIASELRDNQADLIVTLGGGSLTDGAKIASFACANSAFTLDDLDKIHIGAKPDPASLKTCNIHIINIPTTLSGGEYTIDGGATHPQKHRKSIFRHHSMGTHLVILDPALTISTPGRVWLSSGMRAVDHCVEGLCSVFFRHGQASSETKAVQEKHLMSGLGLLLPSLLVTKMNPGDLVARRNEMLGVIEAIRGTTGVAMGASHGIGHQLGPLGVGHGETSCVVLPSVLKWNYQHGESWVKERQSKVLNVFWGHEMVARVLSEAGLAKETSNAGEVVEAYIKFLSMPTRLSDVGIGEDQIGAVADNAMNDDCILTNPVKIVEVGQLRQILEFTL